MQARWRRISRPAAVESESALAPSPPRRRPGFATPAVCDGPVTGTTYAIYPPSGAGLPWLAVVLRAGKPVDMFGCDSRAGAEALLRSMRARRGDPNGGARETYL